MTAGARRLAAGLGAAGWLLAVAAGIAPRAAHAGMASVPITVTTAGDDTCTPRLRDLVVEQLAEVSSGVTWLCRPRFDTKESLSPPGTGPTGVRIWVDLSTSGEARLTLGDTRTERFVVRRVALPTGLDEVAREEIAHILRSATAALLSGVDETLTRAQAETALSTWSPRSASAATTPAPPSEAVQPRAPAIRREQAATTGLSPAPVERVERLAPVVQLGPAWSLQAFSRQIPVVQEIALSLTAARAAWPLALWTEAGYRLPGTYRADPVGVSLDALTLRFGPLLAVRVGRAVSLGFAAGLGLEWNSFSPLAASGGGGATAPAFVTAPADRFVSVSGRVALTVAYHPARHLALSVRLFCDVAAADVHYDFRDVGGMTQRVVVPFAVSPGLTLAVAWRSQAAFR